MARLPQGLAWALLVSSGLAGLAEAAEASRFINIPTLSVSTVAGQQVGLATILVIQIDRLPQPTGPDIQFNEGSRALGVFKGSALGPDWKDSARTATLAATNALGEDPRMWQVTFKDVSKAYLEDGPSAGAAVAVAMVAALRGVQIPSGAAITGAIDAGGRIFPVGGLPEKLQAAAANGYFNVVVPAGQTRTPEWDLRPLAETLGITVIEVSTLKEAYERMTGQSF